MKKTEADLMNLIRSKDPKVLDEVLEHPDIKENIIVLLLRNPYISSSTIMKISENKVWMQSLRIQAEIVNNPKTPQSLSLELLPNLHSMDLLKTAKNNRISPFIRRKAEITLLEKMRKMPIGEKVNIARRATIYMLKTIAQDKNLKVLKALAENPVCTEQIICQAVSREDVPQEFFEYLMQHFKWKNRYYVKLLIVKSPCSPIKLVLKLLEDLKKHDLIELSKDEKQPDVILKRIREILESR